MSTTVTAASGRSITRLRARRARTCRSSRGDSSPSTASPSRGPPARRPAAHGPARHRARCSAGSLPACTTRRALRRRSIRPRSLHRRKHRRARADHDVDVAAADPLPLVVPLAVGQRRCAESPPGRRMSGGTARPWPASARFPAPASARAGLVIADGGGQPQVDLGLAAAGDSVQQRRVKSPGYSQSLEPRQRAPLAPSSTDGRRSRRRRRENRGLERIAIDALAAQNDQAFARHARDRRGADPLLREDGGRHTLQPKRSGVAQSLRAAAPIRARGRRDRPR